MNSTQPPKPIAEINNEGDSDEEEENSSQPSGFDRIISDFAKLDALVLSIQNAFTSTSTNSDPAGAGASNEIIVDSSNVNNGGAPATAAAANSTSNASEKAETMLKKDVKQIRKNVTYIKDYVNKLESSPYCDRAEELLQYLMYAADHQSVEDFTEHSNNLNHLLQIVAKLKNWVPPPPPEKSGNTKNTTTNQKKKESPIVSKKDKDHAAAEIVKTLVSYDCEKWGMDGLLKSYGELEVRDKLCLLCFSVFPCDVDKVGKKKKDEKTVFVQKNLVINKKVLIYWWVGEGFINRNSVPQSNPSTDSNSVTHTNSQEIPTPLLSLDSVDENPNSTPNQNATMSTEGNTIEEIGEKILKVLREKGFIEPVMRRGRESGSYQMHPFVHSFITALAKRGGFFDFRKVNGKLSTRFTLSRRACLLKSQGDSLSSCRRWKDKIDDRTELKKFATVQTLFNVNESIIDIKPEWFSKMKYLSVLHLGSWRSEAGDHIEVEDPKFMEDLKNMKQLKLFSLQGVSTIVRLPDPVCKLSNLIILDLRECHNLEELPPGIGSLKNLTHLDITNCHLLTKLPIGISLLSKLEVLNGFVIYNQDGKRDSGWWKKTKGFVVHDVFRRDNKEVCILRDLLKLGNLRELSIVVNRDDFPKKEEVKVLREMRELCSIKISWVYDFENVNRDQTVSNQGDSNAREGSSSHKCGRCDPDRIPESSPEMNSESSAESSQKEMKKLEKLELWCFPCKNPPDWLVPNELKSLKKLYIKGGSLERLNGNGWNVEMLRLKYLRNLEIKWGELNEMFPKMKYLEKYECKKMGLFPCDHEGVWRDKGKKIA